MACGLGFCGGGGGVGGALGVFLGPGVGRLVASASPFWPRAALPSGPCTLPISNAGRGGCTIVARTHCYTGGPPYAQPRKRFLRLLQFSLRCTSAPRKPQLPDAAAIFPWVHHLRLISCIDLVDTARPESSGNGWRALLSSCASDSSQQFQSCVESRCPAR